MNKKELEKNSYFIKLVRKQITDVEEKEKPKNIKINYVTMESIEIVYTLDGWCYDCKLEHEKIGVLDFRYSHFNFGYRSFDMRKL